jgi:restriction system protein
LTLWLVRAGEHGDQEPGVLDNKIVAIGWNKLPDLSSIQDKEKLEEIYVKFYGSEKKKDCCK